MSGHIPPKKFPYLVVQNGSGDNVEDVGIGPHGAKKREVERRSNPSSHGVRILPYATQTQGQDYIPGLSGFIPVTPPTSRAPNPHPLYQNPSTTAYNLSKMKAILTAQNEIRKPASSLYPSGCGTGTQMSLIPETEEIYRKYFPAEETPPPPNMPAAGVPYRKPGRDLGGNKQTGGVPNTAIPLLEEDVRSRKDTGTMAGAAVSSSSESNITRRQRPVTSSLTYQEGNEVLNSGPAPDVVLEIQSSPSRSPPLTDRQLMAKQCLKDAVAESKFKKRIQSQLLSLTTEIDRQSCELTDLRKELKDLRQATRTSTSDQHGAKSRLDTLSKQVQEIDSKMDTIQESVTSQEKSFLNKLMMLGDLSDSDSDDIEESSGSIKFFDPFRSSSATKLTALSSATGKRTGSARNGTRPTTATTSGSVTDAFPKVCSNWIPIAPDFDKLIHSVAILNYRMDRNQSMKMTKTTNGSGTGTTAAFKHSDVIDLTLYKNGMNLGSAGFRSYSTMSVIKFVNEIFNGYLPTELSTQYPDGVVIVLTDKRAVNHSNDIGFNGSGLKLVKQDEPSIPDLMPGGNINSLPKKKDNSSEYSQASATVSQVSLSVSTSVNDCDILPDLILERNGESRRSAKIIRLKINDAKTGTKYKLKVSVNVTIKALSEHLRKSLEEREDIITAILTNGLEETAGPKTIDIILPVPCGKLACLDSTLEDYGIAQNTLLCIQEHRKFTY